LVETELSNSLEIQTLGRGSDDERMGLDMLIYGRSGAGKTYRAGTAPKPFIVSPDPTGHKAIPYEVPGKLVRCVQDAVDVLEFFQSGGHVGKADTLIVDGISFLYDLYVKEVGQYMVDYHGAKDPDLMPISGRLKINNKFKQLLRDMIDLTQINPPERRVHVIMTTLEERVKEDEEAPFNIRPHFGTQTMNQNLPALFTVIGYIAPYGEDSEGNLTDLRKMLFTEYKGILARDRTGTFPAMCAEAPNLSEYLQ